MHILLYTLPGVPSLYYGSEFGIEGKKEKWSDDSLRPELHLEDFKDAVEKNPCTKLIAALGQVRHKVPALSYGDYRELQLMNRQYAFSRNYKGTCAVVTVNNDDSDFVMTLPVESEEEYIGALFGQRVTPNNRSITVNVKANSGDIWVPAKDYKSGIVVKETIDVEKVAKEQPKPVKKEEAKETVKEAPKAEKVKTQVVKSMPVKPGVEEKKAPAPEKKVEAPKVETTKNSEEFERGKIAGLQEAILAIMEKNGPVTDQMRKDVMDNVYHDSLINWVKSFR